MRIPRWVDLDLRSTCTVEKMAGAEKQSNEKGAGRGGMYVWALLFDVSPLLKSRRVAYAARIDTYDVLVASTHQARKALYY